MKIITGSKNPVKVNASEQCFARIYPEQSIDCSGINAPSGVADQPLTLDETRQGALNRLSFCKDTHPEADYHVAIEGGIDLFEDGPCTFAIVAIANNAQTSIGCSARLPLPAQVYQALLDGEELGDVMDRLFNQTNIKQKGGAIGILTNGLESRQSAYQQALTLAMAKFLYPELYY